jgi:hypothetical protein
MIARPSRHIDGCDVKLLSYYSIGALVSVLLLAVLLNRVIQPITVMVLYPVIAPLFLGNKTAITVIANCRMPAVESPMTKELMTDTAG